MQEYYFDIIKREMELGQTICAAFIVEAQGTTPREVGTSMIIKSDNTTLGTIGGGQLEYIVVKEADSFMKAQISGTKEIISYKDHDENNEIISKIKVFFKVYLPRNKLIIFGGGHVGYNLYDLATKLHFPVIMVDEREGFLDEKKYEKAQGLIKEKTIEAISQDLITPNTYVVIVSSTHKSDQEILKRVIEFDCKYIGMLGSKKKVTNIFNNIVEAGVEQSRLEKVHAPIGLEIGGETPEEVALSIMAQIVSVKNDKSSTIGHMKLRGRG